MKAITKQKMGLGLLGVLLAGITATKTPPANTGFAVVELFTSEGCSSCPPADQLIEKIQAAHTNDPVYILAFHVDYWDHQGWKDRFSAPEYTARQRQYANRLQLETIYTPQAVVNGATEMVGSNERSLKRAIADGLQQTAANTLLLTGTVKENSLRVEYKVTGNTNGSELVLALVQKSAASEVKAGENTGRKLSHVQVVRQLVKQELHNQAIVNIKLNKEFNPGNWELIGMVQQKTNGHITAATRINL
jgi:hypothetical protein